MFTEPPKVFGTHPSLSLDFYDYFYRLLNTNKARFLNETSRANKSKEIEEGVLEVSPLLGFKGSPQHQEAEKILQQGIVSQPTLVDFIKRHTKYPSQKTGALSHQMITFSATCRDFYPLPEGVRYLTNPILNQLQATFPSFQHLAQFVLTRPLIIDCTLLMHLFYACRPTTNYPHTITNVGMPPDTTALTSLSQEVSDQLSLMHKEEKHALLLPFANLNHNLTSTAAFNPDLSPEYIGITADGVRTATLEDWQIIANSALCQELKNQALHDSARKLGLDPHAKVHRWFKLTPPPHQYTPLPMLFALSPCSNPICKNMGHIRCSRCNFGSYCSPACQKKHWLYTHKQSCYPAIANPLQTPLASAAAMFMSP